jgi:hypothetical protein
VQATEHSRPCFLLLQRFESQFVLHLVPLEGLNLLRFRRFTFKVMTSSKFVEVHTLPPTSNAAHFHILRVFHQVKQWIGEADNMEAKDWGWCIFQISTLGIN